MKPLTSLCVKLNLYPYPKLSHSRPLAGARDPRLVVFDARGDVAGFDAGGRPVRVGAPQDKPWMPSRPMPGMQRGMMPAALIPQHRAGPPRF